MLKFAYQTSKTQNNLQETVLHHIREHDIPLFIIYEAYKMLPNDSIF